jgi:8-amino-7-oxononanoate synthase
MTSIEKILSEKIDKLQHDNLIRSPKSTERLEGAKIIRNGKRLVSFSCNDYLGLSQNKKIIIAGNHSATKYGSGAGASRLITGNNPLYTLLEKKIAEICRTESALIYGSGYMANIGVITALVGAEDLILADKLSHSCIIEGSKLSRAELLRFAHNNIESLKELLAKNRKSYKNCLVITESVFSMDGDSPDLKKILKLCKKHSAWLLVDYAHDINHLTGTSASTSANLIKMGTFSKAVGTYGGYIAGTKTLIDYLKSVSKTFIFTTGLPPAVLGSSLKSLEIIQKQKGLAKKALGNAQYFRDMISSKLDELDIGKSNSQIVPIIIGGIEDTIKISEYLYENGFLVSAIRPPTVPVNTSRLRFSFSAAHDKKDIDKLVKLLIKYFKKR